MARPCLDRCLVVGASSGIGRSLVVELIRRGSKVCGVARREGLLKELQEELGEENFWWWSCDVREYYRAGEVVQEAAKKMGGLDAVFYCAGVLHRGHEEKYDTSEEIEMVEVNLAGAVAWLGAAAARFSSLGRGVIVGIGSIAGDRGRYLNPVYNATKAGLHTYLEGLRNRLWRKGVRVVTIKPGFVDTAMTKGMEGLFWLIGPDKAAKIILKKVERGVQTAYVPARWRLVSLIIRSIPSFLFRRMRI